ncbi:hypothetical protein ACIQ4I_03480 [Rummeliibacillus sp. NPDC094406]|uniref:hypothetical protein n=1 Tax=Rummeliibacillus sp. NPDC094406 TaxID=3364511 RepID=UPI00381B7196
MKNEVFIQYTSDLWKGEYFKNEKHFSSIEIGVSLDSQDQEVNLGLFLAKIIDYPCTVVLDGLFASEEDMEIKMKVIKSENNLLIGNIYSRSQFEKLMHNVYINAINGLGSSIIIGRKKKEIPFEHFLGYDLVNDVAFPNLLTEEIMTFLDISEVGISIRTLDEKINKPKKLLPLIPDNWTINLANSDLEL